MKSHSFFPSQRIKIKKAIFESVHQISLINGAKDAFLFSEFLSIGELNRFRRFQNEFISQTAYCGFWSIYFIFSVMQRCYFDQT